MSRRIAGLYSLQILRRVVPAARRQDWYAEWEGELAQARAEGHGRVFRARRLLNAAEDAIRLGLRRGIRRPLASFVEGSAQDLRYAVRALVRRPAYVAGAVFALALGIGANTAIFSIVHGVLFHPLPYAEPDRLMLLWGDGSRRGLTTFAGAPPAEFLAWTARASSFTGMAALSNNSVAFTQFDEPLVPLTHVVTENYFDVLGVEPYLGRTFEAGDATGTGVVVVSHRIWQRSLGGDPALIGKTVVLDDEPFVVIGILRPDFYSTHQLPVQPDLWMPTVFAGREQDRATRNNAVFARLKPGVTVAQAQQEMSAIAADAEAELPESNSGWSVKVTPVRDNTVGAYRQTFGFLLLAVGLVLLIACANVANLGLAHAIERSREVALRSALGAGRGRLLRQMVSEGLVLATLGGGVGVLVAFAALPVLLRLIPGTGAGGSTTIGGLAAVPFLEHVGVNSTVLGFAAVLCVLTGIVAALAPARVAGRQTLSSALQDGSRGSTTGGRAGRLRGLLVITETAVSVVLLVGASLLLQSFRNLQNVELGYDANRLITLRNSLRIGPDPEAWTSHFEQAAAALEELPGIESASAVSFVPPEFANAPIRFHGPGDAPDAARNPNVVARIVMRGYFETMGIALLSGRTIDQYDTVEAAPVLVVNAEFARRYFGDRDPIGQRIVPELTGTAATLRRFPDMEWEIVGLVANVRGAGTDPAPFPMVYVSAAHLPLPIMNLVARTREAPESMLRPAEQAIWSLGTRMNVYSVETLQQRLGNLMWQSRFAMQLLAIFAGLALILGTAGIYAVLTYTVSRRTQEMGVRMALGADRQDVLTLVIGGGLRMTVLGVVFGTAASLAVSRLLAGLLYGVAPGDPVTVLSVALTLLAVATAACLSPALRATRVDSVDALKS